MKRTVDEKYRYNKTRKDDFSLGYCFGVDYYRSYPKQSPAEKQARKNAITKFKGSAAKGHAFSKGVMCGIRDTANERKSR